MSTSSEDSKLSIARRYIQLTNDRNFDELFELYEWDATYEMRSTPTEKPTIFSGLDAIKGVTLKYFNEFAPNVKWEAEHEYQVDNSFEPDLAAKKNYKEGDAVVNDFKQTADVEMKSGSERAREWVCVNDRGKIYYVKLVNLGWESKRTDWQKQRYFYFYASYEILELFTR